MNTDEIKKKLTGKLKHKRYEHTIGVAYTAAALAMRYDPALMDKALRAGLLHDCAKYMTDDEYLSFCKIHDIKLSQAELAEPGLIHAKAGVYIAANEYEETDTSVLEAIRWHTTGKPDMSLLEKIVFTADYIEPARDHLENLPDIRRLAFEDLDMCIVKIYEHTLSYINSSGKTLDEITTEAYTFYRKKCCDR